MKPIRYTPEMIDEYLAKGCWSKEIFPDFCDRYAREYPDKEALVDVKTRLTWSQVKQQMDRLALGFLELGIKRDEVIVCQTPNWVEIITLVLGLEKAGILFLAGMMAWRHEQMEHLLKTVEAVAVVIPWEFKGFDYFKMIKELQPNLPNLKHIIVAGDKVPPATISLRKMTENRLEDKYPSGYLQKTKFGATETSRLFPTSGSTGLPKLIEWADAPDILAAKHDAENLKMGRDDVVAALAFLYGPTVAINLYSPLVVGAKIVMLEGFDPEEALKLIERERVTIGAALSAQVNAMVRHPNFQKYDVSSLRAFYWTGAPLPYYMALEAEQEIGATMIGAYGTADAGGFTISSVDDPPEVRHLTSGKPYAEMEIKLVDESGKEVPQGEVGEVLVRGACCPPGYYKDPEAVLKAWGEMGKEGWYSTGDLAKFDELGNLIIIGRKVDVIRRGEESIYPTEVENLLLTHPRVLNVAVVRMPDPVMGEKACAYVIPRAGQEFTFEEMSSFLKEKELPPSKFPERLEIMESFPMSGDGLKVLKRGLAEDVAQKLKAEGENRPSGRAKLT